MFSNSRLNTVAAWVFGIALSGAVFLLLTELANLYGFVTYIDYGQTIVIEHRYYDETKDGDYTSIGTFIMFLATALGIRGGMAVFKGSLNGGVSRLGNIQLATILICFLLYAVIEEVIWFLFDDASYPLVIVPRVLSIASLVGIGFVGYRFYEAKKAHEDTK